MPKPYTVRLLALDGVWEVPGVDRSQGVWAEDLETEGDRWGASKASFTLKREARYVWPDLRAFNRVEIETDTKCFSGRIAGTPAHSGDDRQISVQVEGLQYHLDDDQYEKIYAHNKLSDYRDLRSYLGANLTSANTAGKVVTDKGIVTIGWAKGDTVVTNNAVGVMLDLGPGQTWKRIVVDWEKIGAATDVSVFFRGSDSDEPIFAGPSTDAFTVALSAAAASTTTAATIATARRYVALFLFYNGPGGAWAADQIMKIKSVQVFADTAYESGNTSALKAPAVIKDALAQATSLFSSDQSLIDPANTVTTNLPAFAPTEPKTPREVFEAVNGIHDYRLQVDVQDRIVFGPKPSAPIFEVGDSAPLTDEPDDGAGSEVYNRVIAVGQTPDGAPLRVTRSTGDTDSTKRKAITTPAPGNPSFDVDTSTWSTSGGAAQGTITRDTTVFDSSPASAKWSSTGRGGNDAINETFTGATFKAGTRYILTFAAKASVSTSASLRFGDINAPTNQITVTIGTGFAGFEIGWTPAVDAPAANVKFSLLAGASAADIWVDSLKIMVPTPTIVDRQGLRRTMRLPVSFPLPADGVLAAAIADVWLGDHKLIPFKGTITVQEGAIRDVLTGATVPLELLPLRTMELLRFNDRNDPDTGGQGRDGRIVAAKWIHAEDRCEITIDNTRAYFEQLLQRLGAVFGG